MLQCCRACPQPLQLVWHAGWHAAPYLALYGQACALKLQNLPDLHRGRDAATTATRSAPAAAAAGSRRNSMHRSTWEGGCLDVEESLLVLAGGKPPVWVTGCGVGWYGTRSRVDASGQAVANAPTDSGRHGYYRPSSAVSRVGVLSGL